MDQEHQHHLSHLQYLNQQETGVSGDRFPQWNVEETKEFIKIRGELDETFMETKRNKLLWEVVSNKMRDIGFSRSPEQCKCKWKNLVTRFKGCEVMEGETARHQFPFFDDMQTIFTTRMQRKLWAESEGRGGGSIRGIKKANAEHMSSDEEEEELLDIKNDSKLVNSKKKICLKKRKGINNGVRELLDEFMRQHMKMEKEWRERWEMREKEREEKEGEWRRKMETLEKEKASMEEMWRNKEEERRAKEETRALKRDSLINALLHKLNNDPSLLRK